MLSITLICYNPKQNVPHFRSSRINSYTWHSDNYAGAQGDVWGRLQPTRRGSVVWRPTPGAAMGDSGPLAGAQRLRGWGHRTRAAPSSSQGLERGAGRWNRRWRTTSTRLSDREARRRRPPPCLSVPPQSGPQPGPPGSKTYLQPACRPLRPATTKLPAALAKSSRAAAAPTAGAFTSARWERRGRRSAG